MKKIIILSAFFIFILPPIFGQTDTHRVAHGAERHLATLLNKPAMVKHPVATHLGKNWFTLETDAHVFSDQVSVRQVAEVFLDVENQAKFFDGKKSKLTAHLVSSTPQGDAVVDFVAIAMVLTFQLKTPYRAATKIETYTNTKFLLDIKQIPQDSATNTKIKNLYAPRYVEEVTIDGKKYTYIRIYAKMDVDASILPGAKGTLEKNSGPTNEEALELILKAAKTK